MGAFRHLILIVCYSLPWGLKAQNQQIADSLANLLTQDSKEVSDSTLTTIYLNLGLYESSPVKALEYSREALKLAQTHNIPTQVGAAYEAIAANNRIMGNKTTGFEASFKALHIFDSLQLSGKKAALLLQIGSQYTGDENYPQGIRYLRQSLNSFKLIEDHLGVSQALLNLGETYRLTNQLDSAIYCFEQVLANKIKVPDLVIEAYAQGNLGMIHRTKGLYDSAIPELQKAVQILSELGEVYALSVYKAELGLVMIEQGFGKKGSDQIIKALNIAKTHRLKEQIRDLSRTLSFYYAGLGNYTQAFAYQEQYTIYQDSLINAASIRKVEEIKYNYELDKKLQEIENITLKNELAETKLDQRQTQLFIVIIIGSFLLVFLWVVYQAYKRNKAAKILLANKNDVIKKQSTQKELLHKELHHRVKNNLQLIGSLMSLQSFNTKDKEVASAMKEGKSRVEALTLIHQSLYGNEEVTHVNFKDYLGKLCQNFTVGYQDQMEAITYDSIDLNIKTDDVIPIGLIVNEAICNAIKHRGEKTVSVKVDFQVDHNGYQLSIMDNGPGGLIWPNAKGSSQQGFGTNLIATLADQVGAVVDIESNDNGTIIKLALNRSIASTFAEPISQLSQT